MSQKEIKRFHIIKKLLNQEFNGSSAAVILKLSTRHIRRLKNKVRQNGAKGLVHGSRGRVSNRKIPDRIRDKIIKLLQEKYYDFGPSLAAEKLAKNHGIDHDSKTIRQIMIGEELWRPRKIRGGKNKEHREWRQRKANYGEMIQYDGSYEHWFENRGGSGEVCLLAAIDDATGKVLKAKFCSSEGVEPTFGFWKEYIIKNGKPCSIYVDKFSTYSMNRQTAKENEDALTQFKRAMEKDLRIEVITANSPQAKGRIERLFKTLQDRLIKELRLNHISAAKEANEFLEKIYMPEFNARFAVEPRAKADLHQKLNVKELNQLESIFSRQVERVVRNDFTISYKKNWYQLEEVQPATICKQDIIIVEERMDESIHFRLRGKYLNYRLLPERAKKINLKTSWVIPAGNTKGNIPPENHPWRKIFYAQANRTKHESRTFLNPAK